MRNFLFLFSTQYESGFFSKLFCTPNSSQHYSTEREAGSRGRPGHLFSFREELIKHSHQAPSSVKGTLLPFSPPPSLCSSLPLCLSVFPSPSRTQQSYRAPYTDLAAELGGPILNIRSLPHIFGRDFYAPFALACQICQVFLFCEAKLYSTDVLAHFFFSLPVQFSSVVKQLELVDESKPHSSKNYSDQVS